jgi:hypothetical protein
MFRKELSSFRLLDNSPTSIGNSLCFQHSIIALFCLIRQSMRPLFDYLFYCFYCLTAKDKPDRAGTSLTMLSLFVLFLLLDLYTLAIGLLHLKSHFFIAGVGSMVVAQSFLHFRYIRPKTYEPLIVRYNQGEFKRLYFALIGVGLLLTVMFLPFPILKASR